MISYPCAKINIGLNILEKRSDGYHHIESVFYPIPLVDILEINFSKGFSFTASGLNISGDSTNNLVVKAFNLLKHKHKIENVAIHLHKQIPMGAGLGGGSSDAATTLTMLNSLFELNLPIRKLEEYALKLGSDCPFFIDNRPKYVTGIGEKMEIIDMNLSNYFIYLVNPEIHIGTAEAYAGVLPAKAESSLLSDISDDMVSWREKIKNDFEITIFEKYSKLADIKKKIYNMGAIYASMSGSGSTIYGLFKEEPKKANISSYERILKLQ